MKKYLRLVPLFLFLAYLAYDFFYNRYRISNLHYGVKANELRMKLHIPIIDDYLKAQSKYDAFFGNRWEADKDLPIGNEPLHFWKIVTPLNDSFGLYEEADSYRKKYSDTLYLQMNIDSKVQGDTLAIRSGKLFFLDHFNLLDIDLSEIQIDSVAERWGLTYLVRKK